MQPLLPFGKLQKANNVKKVPVANATGTLIL